MLGRKVTYLTSCCSCESGFCCWRRHTCPLQYSIFPSAREKSPRQPFLIPSYKGFVEAAKRRRPVLARPMPSPWLKSILSVTSEQLLPTRFMLNIPRRTSNPTEPLTIPPLPQFDEGSSSSSSESSYNTHGARSPRRAYLRHR